MRNLCFSPYILFSISKMQKYKVLYKNAKVTSFSSLISKEWKALTEEEKKKWKMFAEQDKLRYNTEKRFYKGPWQVPSERLRKVCFRFSPPSSFLVSGLECLRTHARTHALLSHS